MSKKMSKGYDAQDRVLAGFRRAAKSSNINSAVARAMRNKKKVKTQNEEVVFSPLALIQLQNG
jgi:hypothetical protein|tara:strand:+ start:335 stop:523 length:189 start_codon:yes stop_codon:yes gene_type:complete